MDMDLLLIMIMIITTTAIIGGSVNGVVQKVLDYKRSVAGMHENHNTTDASQQQIADRTDLIEDRLRVLERLATDRGTLLSDEIEALRSDVHERREKENG